MNPDEKFTIEDSEDFILNFRDITDGPMSEVAAALRSLAKTPPLPARAKPRMFPSQVTLKPSSRFKFFGGGVVTGIATVGIAAGLALGAAAVTGNMPPVISDVTKKAVNAVSRVLVGEPIISENLVATSSNPTAEGTKDQLSISEQNSESVDEKIQEAPAVAQEKTTAESAPDKANEKAEQKKEDAKHNPVKPSPSAEKKPEVDKVDVEKKSEPTSDHKSPAAESKPVESKTEPAEAKTSEVKTPEVRTPEPKPFESKSSEQPKIESSPKPSVTPSPKATEVKEFE